MTEQLNSNQTQNASFPKAITLVGQATVFHAIEKGDLDTIKFYVSHGYEVNEDMGMVTPLTLAIAQNKPAIIDYLIRQGADVNEPSKYGTPLDYIQGILMRPELDPDFERNTLHTQKLLKKAGAKTLETLEKEMKETLSTPPCFALPTPVAFQKPVAPFIKTQNTLEKE